MLSFFGRGFSFPLGERTYIMGILNVTPDSFFDGGKWNEPQKAAMHAREMEADGAALIDVGAQSTRPGHTPLSETQELEILRRFLPAVKEAVQVPISVDTFYPAVAQYALANGASIINDVSGVLSKKMAAVVRTHEAGWILMHTGGANAERAAVYPNGVCADVRAFFQSVSRFANEQGLKDAQICLDPGFGFGKSHRDNLALLRGIASVKPERHALLTALSCKRMIAQEAGASEEQRLFGTVAADTIAIAGGTDFIRVHHVREAKAAADMADALTRRGGDTNG